MGTDRSAAEELGRRVKAARVYKDVTQIPLANRLGIGRDTLGRWESGKVDADYKREKLENAAAEVTDMPREFFAVDFDDLPNMVRAWKQVSRLPNPDDLRDLVDEKLNRDPTGG